jgi:hypothetical protein
MFPLPFAIVGFPADFPFTDFPMRPGKRAAAITTP